MLKNMSTKKKLIIGISIIIFTIFVIFIVNIIKTNIIHNKYQNKLFIYESASLFFLEPWDAKDITEEFQNGEIYYIDEKYIYKFYFIDSSAATGLVNDKKTTYNYEGDSIIFELDEGKYKAQVEGKSLTITLLETTKDSESYLGDFVNKKEYYVALDNYDYFELIDTYKTNLKISLNNYKLKIANEIGNIIGNSLYNQKYGNADFGFQYNFQNTEHPFTIIENSKTVDNLVIYTAKKISNTMFTISLANTTIDDNSIFSLVLDTSNNSINVSFNRIYIPTNETYYNGLGIYEIPLTLAYNIKEQTTLPNYKEEDVENDNNNTSTNQNSTQNNSTNDYNSNNNNSNNSENNETDENNKINENVLLTQALDKISITLKHINEDYFQVNILGKDDKYNYKIIYNGTTYSNNIINIPYKGYGETCYEFEIIINDKLSKTINKCITLNREKLDYQVIANPITNTGKCRVSIKTNNTSNYNQLNKTKCVVDGKSYGICEYITGFYVESGNHSITIINNYEEQTINFTC